MAPYDLHAPIAAVRASVVETLLELDDNDVVAAIGLWITNSMVGATGISLFVDSRYDFVEECAGSGVVEFETLVGEHWLDDHRFESDRRTWPFVLPDGSHANLADYQIDRALLDFGVEILEGVSAGAAELGLRTPERLVWAVEVADSLEYRDWITEHDEGVG